MCMYVAVPLQISIETDIKQHACILLYSVDSNSLAEEGGVLVGDQILDVNGHSFISILHQEAVHILRTYQTLILTIKVRTVMV